MSVGAPGSDVTPCELASAYATIAARGMYSAPHLISEVKDADGKLVYKRKGVTRCGGGEGRAALGSACSATPSRRTGS